MNAHLQAGIRRWTAALCTALCVTAAAESPPADRPDGTVRALHPFYSYTETEDGTIVDVLWPLYSRKTFADERSSRGLFLYYTHEFETDEPPPHRRRRWLLPFLFEGRDAVGQRYAALFPLGGTIHEFLGRDEIAFALFPLFVSSRINDVQSTSVLWPVFSRTRGEGVRRDRIFPLYGRSRRAGVYEKRFVLWPIWNDAHYLHPEEEGRVWILFPLIGRAELAHEQTWWLLPPLFRFTRGDRQDKLFCPWPFIQKVNDKVHDKLYLWPLWGRDQYAGGINHRTFVLWPIFWSERTAQGDITKTRRIAMPFFYLERDVLNEEGVPKKQRRELSREWKLWPLMNGQRDETGSRFRMLDLWPVNEDAPVERNWAPVWTLFEHREEKDRTQTRLLWGLWTSNTDRSAKQGKWSLLNGLLEYHHSKDGRGLRLFYFLHMGKRVNPHG